MCGPQGAIIGIQNKHSGVVFFSIMGTIAWVFLVEKMSHLPSKRPNQEWDGVRGDIPPHQNAPTVEE